MRCLLIVGCAALLAACGRKDANPGADTTAMDTPASTIALADVAGTWNIMLAPENSDSTLLEFTFTATADTTGWSVTFPGREPVPVRVTGISGDSIMTEMGPYESALRDGVQVTTRSVYRLRGDRLMGTSVAHYQTAGADSVVNFRSRGRRSE